MSKNAITILGIESSCDETSASVVVDGTKVLSNIVNSQIDIHKQYGGVVPEIASRNHIEAIDSVVKQALQQANVTLADIDAVAVTYGAGLVGALFVGVSFAKGLCQASNIPLIAVNHIEAHICANYITSPQLKPPYICLLTSGGNTAIVKVVDYDTYEVLASTVDDAVGEAFDKVARVLGLPYPGGVYVDRLAQQATNPYKFHSVVTDNGNFSYSGLKTAVINTVSNSRQKGIEPNHSDICLGFTMSAIDGLVEQTIKHCQRHNLYQIAIAGGVSANSYLRAEMDKLRPKGYTVYMPDLSLCGDNGAMIGARGYYSYIKGEFADLSLTACPTLKLRGQKPHK